MKKSYLEIITLFSFCFFFISCNNKLPLQTWLIIKNQYTEPIKVTIYTKSSKNDLFLSIRDSITFLSVDQEVNPDILLKESVDSIQFLIPSKNIKTIVSPNNDPFKIFTAQTSWKFYNVLLLKGPPIGFIEKERPIHKYVYEFK